MTLQNGIYEQIINKLFLHKLSELDSESFFVGQKQLPKELAAEYLSRYLLKFINAAIIENTYIDDNEKKVAMVNDIIKYIGTNYDIDSASDNLIEEEGKLLTAILDKTHADYPDFEERIEQITPETKLSSCELFTGRQRNDGLTMESELKREIASADEICFLVAFIKKSGLNLLKRELKEFTDNGGKLRVITTTYTQASDFAAIKELALMKGVEVKISYDVTQDRLHAKSYLFLRNTGFNTAYIGSSNMSRDALMQGLEWNIKATEVELPQIINTVRRTFNAYWLDESFETYTPGKDDQRLMYALGETPYKPIDYSLFDLIRAKDYQNEILDKLTIEREVHGRYKNLIVAATGTGKTVISAFDFKRYKEAHKEKCNLLFVAHREEILRQAIDTFRYVLADENFGELWYSGQQPSTYNAIFASKDTLYSRMTNGTWNMPADYYDYIIIDEAHHVWADSYQPIIKHFSPKILLGMTATPERSNVQEDITEFFDKSISAEIRLADALNNKLLCPFHYYGVTDSVDYSKLKWSAGKYEVEELTKLFTENTRRTRVILDALDNYTNNPRSVKALCFCVSQKHAEYMNAAFTLASLKSAMLTSQNSSDRQGILERFRSGAINYLFVVDMFNEGVDIPAVDTVLFLRPTESLTIYLQQLGRGLRKADGKEFVTVLDFVGNARAEFNYSQRLRATIGPTTEDIETEVKRDFPHLPFGCKIQLERKAKEYILDNIHKHQNSYRIDKLLCEIRDFRNNYTFDLSLKNFIQFTKTPISKLYGRRNAELKKCWSYLKHEARNEVLTPSKMLDLLAMALSNKWLSTDSASYFFFLYSTAKKHFNVNVNELSTVEQKMILMLYYDLFDKAGEYNTLQDFVNECKADEEFCNELCEVMEILFDKTEALEINRAVSCLTDFPLKVHGRYTKAQIQVAISTSTLEKKSSNREGAERNKTCNLEAMYVDLIKDREAGSTTNYKDGALSPDVFTWETQNSVSPTSPVGQSYINKTNTMLLFVREQAKGSEDKNRTEGFIYLGEVELISWSGSRPMQIQWKLKDPMPNKLWVTAHKLVANF